MKTKRVVRLKCADGSLVEIGGPQFLIAAGPCSIESREHFENVGAFVQKTGARLLRGGIFKMRTHPETFQGMKTSALSFVREVKNQVGLPFVSEVTDPRQISDMLPAVDMFQVGSRNMYNYSLLEELGRLKTPVLLKRGLSATIKEWLSAAEYLLKGGNDNIVLCERGIRTFETSTRNTLDLNAVAYIKAHTDFPILVDPSHGTGRPELIAPLSKAAAALGADGIIIEVHPEPAKALSDGDQALNFKMFETLVHEVQIVAQAVGRA